MKYKFLGKPDNRFPKLKTGEIYELDVRTRNSFFNSFIFIASPFMCPYYSWESFYENWKPMGGKK